MMACALMVAVSANAIAEPKEHYESLLLADRRGHVGTCTLLLK